MNSRHLFSHQWCEGSCELSTIETQTIKPMFRRSLFFAAYREASLTELKGVALATLKSKLGGGARPSTVIVDVRQPSELINDGVIPAAINIPLSELADQLNSGDNAAFRKQHDLPEALTPTKHTLLFTCRSGRRSMTAIDIAEASGFQACHYTGGNIGYQRDPITDSDISQYLGESAKNSQKKP
jgi:rhodanese-related sulfurtransferase